MPLFTTAKSTAERKRVCCKLVFAHQAMIFITGSFASANGSKMAKFLAIDAFFVPSGTLALFMFFFTTPATFGFLLEFLEIVFLGIAFVEEIAPITLAFCRLFPEFLVVKADGWV